MIRSHAVWMLGFALAFVSSPAVARDGQSPLHGNLARGAHDVGFTRLRLADPTRPARSKRDLAAPDAARARRIDVHLWYPAAPGSTARPMTFADAMVAHLEDRSHEDRTRREAAVRRFLGQFGAITDEAWTRLTETPLLARSGASPAAGRFPLLIGSLRPLSTAVTNEYLASHGFVVAMVDGEDAPDATDAGAGLDVDYRDMEFAIPELRKLSYVHAARLGALGFSGSGFSQLLLAMRHPDVDAVCDLESAIFDDRMMYPLHRGWGYSTSALRVPFLHTYSVPLSKLENRIGDFEAMRYSIRYRYLVDAPGIHHWDFATEGMAASAVLGIRGANGPALQQAFETTNRYVLQFFKAHVNKDQEALAFLKREPQANGVPAGLATIREYPGITPAPTLDALFAIVDRDGIEAAMRALEDARKTDPQADVFREATLNRLGYQLLRGNRGRDSILVFRKIVDWYPGSSNAYDSLAEALETLEERQQAIDVTRQGLEVLARQQLTDEQRRQMADLLQARLERLR